MTSSSFIAYIRLYLAIPTLPSSDIHGRFATLMDVAKPYEGFQKMNPAEKTQIWFESEVPV